MATVFLQDSFTEASDKALTAHTPEIGGAWVAYGSPYTATMNVLSAEGRIGGSSSAAWAGCTNAVTPPSPDYVIRDTVRFSSSTGKLAGILARYSTSGTENGYVLYYDGSAWKLRRVLAGAGVDIATVTGTWATGTDYPIVWELFGSLHEVWIGGTLVISVTDTGILTAGNIGVTAYSGGRHDAFSASTLDPMTSRLSQTVAEVVTLPTPSPQLSQVVAEVVTSPNPNLQVYQQVAETVWQPVPALQVYQQVVEVIRANGAETPIVPDLNQQPLTIICC